MKRNIIYAAVLLSLFFPKNIYANEIKIDCPKEISSKSEFICQITGNSSMMITGISAKVKVNDSMKIISMITDNMWQGDGKDGNIDIFIDPEVTGTFKIGTLKLKSTTDDSSILIDEIYFYDDKVKSHKVDPITLTIPINENAKTNIVDDAGSNYLVDLKVNNYNLEFYKQNNEYNLTINDEKELDITPILEDESATYEIIGNNNLKDGSKIEIKVSSGNSQNTYIINIKKVTTTKKMTFIFVILISALILINIVRILLKKAKRGNKDE